ncbi:hypothetical protein C7S18_22755 [Ahniella affigens]|uniref:Type 4 fimbrial biogenesis protein PilX N-terminal domain-containing protein n=1 Tax=Ahniella affigens TaxID=2021234 RepID=A0A2P1PYA2_9GAMM|nr:PilX N-terminal domain-containing pilus assembly protein [Ahniella affigens]AVP99821.1 hypothetical protein C7S18_22755 [Ahniella affigens]
MATRIDGSCPVRCQSATRQQGAVLLVAIVLLLVLSLFSLAAVRVGLSEQLSSGNDFRARLTRQMAEGGISHARASLSLLDARLRPDAGAEVDPQFWQACAADDTSFPCGAERNTARRARMYRFIGGHDLNGDGRTTVFEQRSVPLAKLAQGASFFVPATGSPIAANSFPTEYAVGALLCRLPKPTIAETVAPGCTLNPAEAVNQVAYTLVSRAALPGESSTATIVTAVSVKPELKINPNLPALVATGGITGLGSSTLVSAPAMAGNNGQPVSLFSPTDFDGTEGTWQSCRSDQYRPVAADPADPANGSGGLVAGGNGPADCGSGGFCACPGGAENLSGADQGFGHEEGADILDNDAESRSRGPLPPFPCDLFAYALQTEPVRDDRDGDGRCEQGVDLDQDLVNDRVQAYMDVQGASVQSCASLGPQTHGLVWIKQGKDGNMADCQLPAGQIGQPGNNLVLVIDGPFKPRTGTKIFGLVLTRDPAIQLDVARGGRAGLDTGTGQSKVVGALVLEGGGRVFGTNDVIQLASFRTPPTHTQYPPVVEIPGSWTDQYSF